MKDPWEKESTHQEEGENEPELSFSLRQLQKQLAKVLQLQQIITKEPHDL